MEEYVLKGSDEKESYEQRVGFLMALMSQAEQKTTHLSELRQKNLNFALIIFGAMLSLSEKFFTGYYSVVAALVVAVIMILFCLLDRRFHKFIHGWGRTKKELMIRLNSIINEPEKDIAYRRYWSEGEKTTEWRALQPVLLYFLCLGAVAYFVIVVSSLARD